MVKQQGGVIDRQSVDPGSVLEPHVPSVCLFGRKRQLNFLLSVTTHQALPPSPFAKPGEQLTLFNSVLHISTCSERASQLALISHAL